MLSLPNVASVPQYSPLRYPGGKSRWYEFVKAWTDETQPRVFVEPFAGGAHAGLSVAIEDRAEQVILIEKDRDVAAFWRTVLNGNSQWLCNRIHRFAETKAAANEAFESRHRSTRDRAFALLLHNRISRGGITADGAGIMNKGENGKGMFSPWYPKTLIDRIEAIAQAAERITFYEGDAFNEAARFRGYDQACFFVDPPYPKAGGRLYKHSSVEASSAFSYFASAEGDVLFTYDDSEEIQQHAETHGLQVAPLRVSSTHHRLKKEFLIGRDLSWLPSTEEDDKA